ncbi:MAG: M15 family metallopeptidase [Verrucomicrobiota bacterium]
MSTALWKKIQTFVGVAADGIPGDITAEAVANRLGLDKATPRPVPSGSATIDPRSAANIATLTPAAQAKAREWLLKCLEAGINVKIITGTRTYQEQAELYAKGRTAPGPKVTNAPAGYSWHNFGVGWDFVVFDAKGQPLWESPLMERCGRIAESLGLEWGGHWTSFQDTPHIQIKTGCTLAQARQRVKDGNWWK